MSVMNIDMLYLVSIWLLPVLIAITFHEAAHAFVARHLGDETASRLGRVSLNPFRHIDPLGTILLPGLLLLARSPSCLDTPSPCLIVQEAMALRLPLVFGTREGADAGGLASYGVNAVENYRRAAIYVDKILKGAAPGDLPIEFPTKIELVVNLKTAKAPGIKVPPILLDRADELIE